MADRDYPYERYPFYNDYYEDEQRAEEGAERHRRRDQRMYGQYGRTSNRTGNYREAPRYDTGRAARDTYRPVNPYESRERGDGGRSYSRGDYDRFGYDDERNSAWRDDSRFGPHTGRGPKGYQRSAERILEDAHERLTWHGEVDASDIELSVEGDELTLEGTVRSRREKRMAEDAVEGIPGVRDIHNRLRIQREQDQAS